MKRIFILVLFLFAFIPLFASSFVVSYDYFYAPKNHNLIFTYKPDGIGNDVFEFAPSLSVGYGIRKIDDTICNTYVYGPSFSFSWIEKFQFSSNISFGFAEEAQLVYSTFPVITSHRYFAFFDFFFSEKNFAELRIGFLSLNGLKSFISGIGIGVRI